MLQHPFQCTAFAKPPGAECDGFLLAASGPKLLALCLSQGHITSSWPNIEPNDEEHAPPTAASGEPPAKRQKTQQTPLAGPNIIKLVVTPNHQYAIAVTDDKVVRVYSIDRNGVLLELSRRAMPKRPCAILVLPDNETILCGDKFGDVYSLPLLSTEEDEADVETAQTAQGASPTTFKPTANTLTVHSKRNLMALESQMKQKNFAPRKDPLKFKHELLLGHVSMLTDLTFATQTVDGKQRRYIITADRDEHIRLSRAPPQSYIIEGYCLGHTEFISKLCVVDNCNILLSGGGDDWLGVWDWPAYQLRQKVPLSRLSAAGEASTPKSTAVSGIWVVPLALADGSTSKAAVVTIEKSSAALVIPLDQLKSPVKSGPIGTVWRTDSPILDIVVFKQSIVVSFDARAAAVSDAKRLHPYNLIHSVSSEQPSDETAIFQGHQVEARPDAHLQDRLDAFNALLSTDVDATALDGLLYNVSQLRKRRDHEAQEFEANGAADED